MWIAPLLDKAMAMFFFGLKCAFDAGFRTIVAENDCLTLITLLEKKKTECCYAQVVDNDMLALACNFDFCSFRFARRNCNNVAHSLAKASLCFEEEMVWMEE